MLGNCEKMNLYFTFLELVHSVFMIFLSSVIFYTRFYVCFCTIECITRYINSLFRIFCFCFLLIPIFINVLCTALYYTTIYTFCNNFWYVLVSRVIFVLITSTGLIFSFTTVVKVTPLGFCK